MIEAAKLPCQHRICIQCMKENINYSMRCPLCRAPVPSFFKMEYYMPNVDEEYKHFMKKKFPMAYE